MGNDQSGTYPGDPVDSAPLAGPGQLQHGDIRPQGRTGRPAFMARGASAPMRQLWVMVSLAYVRRSRATRTHASGPLYRLGSGPAAGRRSDCAGGGPGRRAAEPAEDWNAGGAD